MAKFTVLTLAEETESGGKVWVIAARRQFGDAPRKMDYGAAVGIGQDEATDLVEMLGRAGSPAHAVMTAE